MLEKWFAKYARAVDDENERNRLYKKYVAKSIVSATCYLLCAVVIALGIILEPYIERERSFQVLMICLFVLWFGFAVASVCLWVSFRRAYDAILNRPAPSGEMPEVTEYRKKVVEDKKSTFKSLLWAWIIFAICVVCFIAFIVMETIKNPDSEEFGIWGDAAFWVLLAGALIIAFAYIINSALKQQQGKSIEQQTERETREIDRAQGRKHNYNLQTDPNLQTYIYLFPDIQLYAEAEEIRKKYSKIIAIGMIIQAVFVVVATILLLASEAVFGKDISGFAMPVAFTALCGVSIILSLPMKRKLIDVEKRQKEELESDPDYAKNLEWYKLYDGFSRFKGKIFLIFIALSVVTGWVLAIIFPSSAWSLLMFVPLVIGLIIDYRLIKELRKKAIPIEKEIDRERFLLHDVRFRVEDGKADENMRMYFDEDLLSYEGDSRGSIELYLGEAMYCMEIDENTGRIVNFTSGQLFLEDVEKGEVPAPKNSTEGNLFAILPEKVEKGTCWRICFDSKVEKGTCWRTCFDGIDRFDPESRNLVVGNITKGLPIYRIFKNCFVQLSQDGVLLGILFTDIIEKEQNSVE